MAQWLRCSATNRKVAGSIPASVIGIFHSLPSCAVVKKFGNFNFLETSGPLQACNGTALPSHKRCMLMSSESNLEACNLFHCESKLEALIRSAEVQGKG